MVCNSTSILVEQTPFLDMFLYTSKSRCRLVEQCGNCFNGAAWLCSSVSHTTIWIGSVKALLSSFRSDAVCFLLISAAYSHAGALTMYDGWPLYRSGNSMSWLVFGFCWTMLRGLECAKLISSVFKVWSCTLRCDTTVANAFDGYPPPFWVLLDCREDAHGSHTCYSSVSSYFRSWLILVGWLWWFNFVQFRHRFTSKPIQLKKAAKRKRQRGDHGPSAPESAPAVEVNWLLHVARNTVSEVESNYQRYPGINDCDGGTPVDTPANVIDDLDVIFAQ